MPEISDDLYTIRRTFNQAHSLISETITLLRENLPLETYLITKGLSIQEKIQVAILLTDTIGDKAEEIDSERLHLDQILEDVKRAARMKD